jgi:hypothetical protein
MTRDLYKPLRQAIRKANALGKNRDERRLLLYGGWGRMKQGLVRKAYALMHARTRARHHRRNRGMGC